MDTGIVQQIFQNLNTAKKSLNLIFQACMSISSSIQINEKILKQFLDQGNQHSSSKQSKSQGSQQKNIFGSKIKSQSKTPTKEDIQKKNNFNPPNKVEVSSIKPKVAQQQQSNSIQVANQTNSIMSQIKYLQVPRQQKKWIQYLTKIVNSVQDPLKIAMKRSQCSIQKFHQLKNKFKDIEVLRHFLRGSPMKIGGVKKIVEAYRFEQRNMLNSILAIKHAYKSQGHKQEQPAYNSGILSSYVQDIFLIYICFELMKKGLYQRFEAILMRFGQ